MRALAQRNHEHLDGKTALDGHNKGRHQVLMPQ